LQRYFSFFLKKNIFQKKEKIYIGQTLANIKFFSIN